MMVSMKVEIENDTIVFNVEYRKRDKLSIEIDQVGFITIKAPKNTSEDTIVKAVKENSKWIVQKLHQISETKKVSNIKKSYHNQGKFFYIGKEFFLHELIDTCELGEEELKSKLKKFYISSLKKIIEERLKIYQQQLGVKPKIVDIVEYKGQWGSCSSSKKLTFNYRLAMFPIEIIDYVIVHELCHLIHMNHDRSFWRLVGSILPDYKKRQEFLVSYGQYMTL